MSNCAMNQQERIHYTDVIMTTIASQITSLTVVYSIIYSDADQRKHQSSASLAFVRGIHRWPVNSPHKWPATRKGFPFDDVIMNITTESTTITCTYFMGRTRSTEYHQNSNISRTLVGNKTVDHSDVVGAGPTGDAAFILDLTPAFSGLDKDNYTTVRETLQFLDLVWLVFEVWR